MRPTVIAGNWKMYNDLGQTEALIGGLIAGLTFDLKHVTVVVCPPFPSLALAARLIAKSSIKLGAQNMHWEEEGAFTGEVSARMLRSSGCQYVILGHSERRTLFGETDEAVNRKLVKARATGLVPIVCVGETLEQREKNETAAVVRRQVEGALSGVPADDVQQLILAYEPVWAIGTGKTATPEQAQEVHASIRTLLGSLYSPDVASRVVIQYGGSVKPDNARQLLAQPDIDGALVGGACLKPETFLPIIRAGVGG